MPGRGEAPPHGGSGPRAVRWLAAAEATLVVEQRLVGLALLRVSAAGVVLLYLLSQWQDRQLIWGPNGIYPSWLFLRELPAGGTSSFLAVESPLLFDLLYHASIVIAALYALGWQTLPVGIAFYGVAWSLLQRTPFLMTGGDSLLLLCLPWLILANTSAYLSLDSGWRTVGSPWRPEPRPWRALVHNVALLALQLQLGTMYLFAGLHKLFGAPWIDGIAAATVLRLDRFSLPTVSPLLYEHELVGRALNYWTIAFELTAPLLMWLPAARGLVAMQSIMFHGGIAVLMGLVYFAIEATMLQLLLFPDASYRRLVARLALPSGTQLIRK